MLIPRSVLSFLKWPSNQIIRNYATVLQKFQLHKSHNPMKTSRIYKTCTCGLPFGRSLVENGPCKYVANAGTTSSPSLRQFSTETDVGSDPKNKKVKTKRDLETEMIGIKTSSRGPNLYGSLIGKGIKKKLNIDKDEWTTVYRFGYIRVARVIQKLKIYQTAFTCGMALPASIGLYLTGVIPIESVFFMLGSSSVACAMLYIMGTFCSRLIGVIYVSKKDSSLVRVAHLNFWGSREDQFFNKEEFIPFSELPDNVSDVYVNVKFYSQEIDTDKLHICMRYGKVYDKLEFEEIFGSTASMCISEVKPKPESKTK